MTFQQVEKLKGQYTDKYVVVSGGAPELRRFEGLTGTVKTINMNGYALVQFDGPADIGWYDIDLTYLKVVDQPLPRAVAPAKKAEPLEKKPVGTAPPGAAAAKTGKSPLELAREQAAAKAGGTPPAVAATPSPASEKPLSKLEQARLQGAGGAKPAAGTPSILERARQQGAAGSAPAAAPAPAVQPAVEAAPSAVAPAAPAEAAPPKPASPPGEAGLSKLELARRQGAFKAKPS